MTFLTVSATDPEGDALTYSWSIMSDPSGGDAFFRNLDGDDALTAQGPQVRLGIMRGPSYPNPSYVGQSIQVKTDVSDGTNTTSFVQEVPIVAVNLAPDIVIDARELGTPEDPRLEGEGFGVNARQSRDPDGGSVKFFWRVVGLTGGAPCAGSAALVLLGKETATPGFVVPRMNVSPSSPARVNIEYIVEDGLYVLTSVLSGYLASPNGNCNAATPPGGGGGNNPPVVSAAVSTTHARFGQTVTLTGNASDPGDTLSYSWVQLSTTGIPQVTISGSVSRVATFVAPNTAGFYSFRFTATDSANQSRSSTVTVQVSQNGGDGGGGGNPPQGGAPSGTATGTLSCSGFAAQGNNQPAVANVPATYTIVGGNRAEISATNGRDPDNTTVNVGGVNVTGAVTYLWTVVDGGGFLTNGALTGQQTATVEFNTPASATQRNATLRVTVNDGVACGTNYNVNLVVTPPAAVNNPPTASLQYQVQGTGENGVNPGAPITVFPPVQITLNASGTDADGDALTYNWSMQPAALQGVTLGSGATSRTLTAASGTVGTVTVTVQVSDGNGGSVTRAVTFQFQPPQDKPVMARASALRDGNPVSGSVPPGKVLVLSGADSEVVEGTAAENANLTFRWEQTSGPAAFVRNLESREAEIIVEQITAVSTLGFRLTARNGSAVGMANLSLTVDPALREETVAEGGDIYFARVGFGPASGLLFQTVAVIDNLSEEDAEDVRIDFYDSQGMPLDVDFLDTDSGTPEIRAWDPETPMLVSANSSRVLEFRAPEDAGLTVGWAVVTSSSRLRGSVRFQLLDDSGSFLSDVGILSSPRGKRFQSAFRSRDGIAFAVTNPESQAVRFQVSLSDRLTGLRVEQNVNLPAGAHVAQFLDDFFPFLNSGGSPLIQEGTVELEIIGEGTMVPTLLITRDRLAVSAQSLARIE